MLNLADLRENYTLKTLDITDVLPDAIQQFQIWMHEALESKVAEPNAMTLATVNSEGKPAARVVLLKGIEDGAMVFYTNYDSHKGRELEANPNAALVFLWLELQRQVRVEGRVERVSRETSEAYFQSRPKASQIGAWVSSQSSTIANRAVLEDAQKAIEIQYADQDVLPLPPNWGGYKLTISSMEFWQGRRSRLHDRLLYTLQTDGTWIIERLAP